MAEVRRCVQHGCETILSRYNSGDRCVLHESRENGFGGYLRRREYPVRQEPEPRAKTNPPI